MKSKDIKPAIVTRNRQTMPEAAKMLANHPKAFLFETKNPLTWPQTTFLVSSKTIWACLMKIPSWASSNLLCQRIFLKCYSSFDLSSIYAILSRYHLTRTNYLTATVPSYSVHYSHALHQLNCTSHFDSFGVIPSGISLTREAVLYCGL